MEKSLTLTLDAQIGKNGAMIDLDYTDSEGINITVSGDGDDYADALDNLLENLYDMEIEQEEELTPEEYIAQLEEENKALRQKNSELLRDRYADYLWEEDVEEDVEEDEIDEDFMYVDDLFRKFMKNYFRH